jgi:hypothetical protein
MSPPIFIREIFPQACNQTRRTFVNLDNELP